jgi:hypothetical protein
LITTLSVSAMNLADKRPVFPRTILRIGESSRETFSESSRHLGPLITQKYVAVSEDHAKDPCE